MSVEVDDDYDPTLDGYGHLDDAFRDELEINLGFGEAEKPYLLSLGVFAPKSWGFIRPDWIAEEGKRSLSGSQGVVNGCGSALNGDVSDGVILSGPTGDYGFSECVLEDKNKNDAHVSEQPRSSNPPSHGAPTP